MSVTTPHTFIEKPMDETSQPYDLDPLTSVDQVFLKLAAQCLDQLCEKDTLKTLFPQIRGHLEGLETLSEDIEILQAELIRWVDKSLPNAPTGITEREHLLYELIVPFNELNFHALAQVCCSLLLNSTNPVKELGHKALLVMAHFYKTRGLFLKAVQSYQLLKELGYKPWSMLNQIGLIFMDLKEYRQALINFQLAAKSDPLFGKTILNMGVAHQHLGEIEEAINFFIKGITVDPQNAFAYYNLGISQFSCTKVPEAIQALEKAFYLKPDWADALYNLGVAKSHLKDYFVAHSCYEFVTALDPAHLLAYYNLGVCNFELLNYEQATHYYEKAIKIDPTHVRSHWNIAHCYLTLGDIRNGLIHYEWRWRHHEDQNHQKQRTFTQPLWLGEPLAQGSVLLIHAEQGFGDTLQFIRYATALIEKKISIIIEVQPALKSLMKSSFAQVPVFSRGETLAHFDAHCPLMSLPLALGVSSISDIYKDSTSYLKVDEELQIKWGLRIDDYLRIGSDNKYLNPQSSQELSYKQTSVSKRLRVGLIWSSGFRPDQEDTWERNKERNIALDLFKELDELSIDLVSLQIGEIPNRELQRMRIEGTCPNLLDLSREIKDFADTAAVAENLDLIISVDTAAAHLCAALGLNTWILLKTNACWRWFLSTERSPWYPSARLFRQTTQNQWAGVTQQVVKALREILTEAAIKH